MFRNLSHYSRPKIKINLFQTNLPQYSIYSFQYSWVPITKLGLDIKYNNNNDDDDNNNNIYPKSKRIENWKGNGRHER